MNLAVDSLGNSHAGGATVLLAFLRTALADDRIETITVFAADSGQREYDFPSHSKLRINTRPWSNRSYPLRAFWYTWGLDLECRRLGVDAIICMNGMGRVTSIPQVTFLQQSLPFAPEAMGTLPTREILQMKIVRWMNGVSTRSATRIITQTPTMKRWVQQAFGLSESRIHSIIPTTVLPKRRPLNDDQHRRLKKVPAERRLLYVGNDNPYKQLDVLLKAMPKIRQSHPRATLFLAGPTKPPNPAPGLEYLGFVPRDQLRHVYQAADIFLIPSLVESCPLPMLEAMSCGLPIVAADRPYAHSVGDDAAEFFDPFNSSELADIVTRLIGDRSVRKQRSRASLKRFEALDGKQPYQRMVDSIITAASVK